jgi:hypothetical protein
LIMRFGMTATYTNRWQPTRRPAGSTFVGDRSAGRS